MKIGNLEFKELPVMLAPMEDVTDPSFRGLCKKFGADVVYTEFISSEGLRRGARKSVQKLDIFDDERPVAIQIFGNDIEAMTEAALIAESANPDFIDINYGCPAKQVAGKGAGSGLLCKPVLMEEITASIVKAVKLPVTAKTRIGWDDTKISILDTVKRLENAGVQAITIHGRTRSQMFKGKANWEWIRKAKDVATVPIVGNGDIANASDAFTKLSLSKVDALMIGRGSIGNPFIFREVKHFLKTGLQLPPPSLKERVSVAIEHLLRSIERKGEKYGVLEMRKHYSTYFRGLPNVSKLRSLIITEKNPSLIIERLQMFERDCEKAKLNGTFDMQAEHLSDHSKKLTLLESAV